MYHLVLDTWRSGLAYQTSDLMVVGSIPAVFELIQNAHLCALHSQTLSFLNNSFKTGISVDDLDIHETEKRDIG